ncbi:response regulator transcription factor [Mucilaginibacter rubeus]|uniref:Response regulator transcription factor n=1 Tax=Mucilaginibacter rubeus TaxID=2027860 RepID=A0AAE6JBD7_9SPHI|nr:MULTISPECIES: LytTR family DNA-binding domain-containing protein [Mucilaginibacter]QEM02426.1 response regulator transcription factor [Mucilaginibacter rubeus]QEM15050.1 response regulator transcription factor [Mucilaginibacter gossypii]QTE42231.1 response regulator transcription factor [Mucilaginibacter rubeus]QTE48833.1 response regulator transcription factor [Mucilaginibacter rubeus]QTE53930.1 response regulator transcription factor [Mucilaginibacter rubeus]
MIINCIAIDDEPLALGLVCAFIEQTPFLKLIGRYSSAVEALVGLQDQKVDLIFLDIQMPNLNGMELARVLDSRGATKPRIIFTTAYNQFAIEGYRVDALDYLLKPFNYEEFLHASNKALTYFELVNRSNTPATVVAAKPEEEEYLFLKIEYQLVRIALNEILYIEGLKDYVKIYLQDKEKPLLSLTSLKVLEEKLPSKRFMRVHRSFIVSLNKINSITRNALQIGKVNISVGDQYKEAFGVFLSKWN